MLFSELITSQESYTGLVNTAYYQYSNVTYLKASSQFSYNFHMVLTILSVWVWSDGCGLMGDTITTINIVRYLHHLNLIIKFVRNWN